MRRPTATPAHERLPCGVVSAVVRNNAPAGSSVAGWPTMFGKYASLDGYVDDIAAIEDFLAEVAAAT